MELCILPELLARLSLDGSLELELGVDFVDILFYVLTEGSGLGCLIY